MRAAAVAVAAALAVVVVPAPCLRGQAGQNPAQQAGQAPFRASTVTIEVDVVVRDRGGRFVTGLTPRGLRGHRGRCAAAGACDLSGRGPIGDEDRRGRRGRGRHTGGFGFAQCRLHAARVRAVLRPGAPRLGRVQAAAGRRGVLPLDGIPAGRHRRRPRRRHDDREPAHRGARSPGAGGEGREVLAVAGLPEGGSPGLAQDHGNRGHEDRAHQRQGCPRSGREAGGDRGRGRQRRPGADPDYEAQVRSKAAQIVGELRPPPPAPSRRCSAC